MNDIEGNKKVSTIDAKKNTNRFSFEVFSFHIVELYIFTIVIDITLASVIFFLGGSLQWYMLPVSFVAAAISTYCLDAEKNCKQILFDVVLAVLIFIAIINFASAFYDFTYDGNAYHKLAVGLLENHWNPLETLPNEWMIEGNGEGAIWVEAYCKSTWIFGASVYAITGNIESAKVYTLIGIFCAFFITYYFLKINKKDKLFCITFSMAAALNPIGLIQFRTFYVDGFLHLVLYVLVVTLILATQNRKLNYIALVASTMIICGNIKFTGLLYGGFFCIAFFCLNSIIECRKGKKNWVRSRLVVGGEYVALLLTILFVVGNTSYLTNLIRHGTIGYPLTGENAIDIISGNSPFEVSNHFGNLFTSMFSYMDNYFDDVIDTTRGLKIPFSVAWSHEKYYYRVPDARISGFGVFFGGLFIVAIITILLWIIRKEKNREWEIVITLLIACTGLMFGIAESWWARYAPYIYFIVLIALYILLDQKAKILKSIGILFFLVLIINNSLSLYWIPEAVNESVAVKESIESISGIVVDAYTPHYNGVYYNLKDKNVKYRINEQLETEGIIKELGYKELVYRRDGE